MRKKNVAAICLVSALAVSSAFTAFGASSSPSTTSTVVTTPSPAGSGSGSGVYSGSSSNSGSTTTVSTSYFSDWNTTKTLQILSGAGNAAFAIDVAESNGLPTEIVNINNSIAGGADLQATIPEDRKAVGLDLAGYKCLASAGKGALVTLSSATSISDMATTVQIYVPNLTSSLSEVKVLFFNNLIGRYQILTPSAIDLGSNTITVQVPCSGTAFVIYK